MGHKRVTGKSAGSAASKTLRTSKRKTAKSVAGSALSQRPGGHGPKK